MVDRLASRTPYLDALLHALIDPERTEFEIRHLDLGRARSVWLAELRREIANEEPVPIDRHQRAERLWEQVGGDLCICQKPEVAYWCEGCQRRIDMIAAALSAEVHEAIRDEEENDDDDGSYLWSRCYTCGHRLRFASDGCPQCGIHFKDGDDPPNWPELCDCERCQKARAEEPK